MVGWFSRRRRRRLLQVPFPEPAQQALERHVWAYALLTADEQRRLIENLRIFIAEKNWEGCAGLKVTEEMRVAVAGWASLLVLNLKEQEFSSVQSILLYPRGYFGPEITRNGLLHGPSLLAGQAHYRGPVILSWEDVERASRPAEDAQNVVLHEFAHQLDMLDRVIDGTPPLADRDDYRDWAQTMTAEYRELARDWEAGRPTVLDPYGTVNEAEFFAVVTETFFVKPLALEKNHANLYALLRKYYRQDPAARVRAHHRANSP